MGSAPTEHEVERFVHALLITGAWLDEVNRGMSIELPRRRYPGEDPLAVVFEMLCGTIGTALQDVEACEVVAATELIDLAAARVEEHLKIVCELAERMRDGADGRGRTYG
jgi:hypothetical protein